MTVSVKHASKKPLRAGGSWVLLSDSWQASPWKVRNQLWSVIYYFFGGRYVCFSLAVTWNKIQDGWRNMSQLVRLWYLSHMRPAKAQASLRIRAVSPELSLFAHIKYGRRRRVRSQIRHLGLLDGCACALKIEFTEDEKCHNLMRWLIRPLWPSDIWFSYT